MFLITYIADKFTMTTDYGLKGKQNSKLMKKVINVYLENSKQP